MLVLLITEQYSPLQDIGARYPDWLESNRDSLAPEDLQRYSRQYEYIQQIVALYESGNPNDFGQLVNLLQQASRVSLHIHENVSLFMFITTETNMPAV